MIHVTNRQQLQDVAFDLGVRKDWHEPDEQDVYARVEGERFDNAGTHGEMTVVLYQSGLPVATVNLATLLAFATGTYEHALVAEQEAAVIDAVAARMQTVEDLRLDDPVDSRFVRDLAATVRTNRYPLTWEKP